jgi:hypothetical protein
MKPPSLSFDDLPSPPPLDEGEAAPGIPGDLLDAERALAICEAAAGFDAGGLVSPVGKQWCTEFASRARDARNYGWLPLSEDRIRSSSGGSHHE